MAPSTLRHDNLKGLTPKIRGVHWLCCRQEQAALIDLSKANKPSAYIMAQLPQIQARHLVSCFDATSVDDCGTLPHSVTSCRLQRASASIYVLSGISDPFGFKSLDIGMIAAIPESVPGIGKLGLRKSPEEMDTHTHTLYMNIYCLQAQGEVATLRMFRKMSVRFSKHNLISHAVKGVGREALCSSGICAFCTRLNALNISKRY